VDRKRLVRSLQELVRIDSSQNISGMSDYVEARLQETGFKVARDSDGNLLSEIGRGEGFLLNAHMDTVKADWEGAFSGVVKDGRVYGRGSSDCKAGVAAMLEIAQLLKEEKLNNRIVFAFTGNEEAKPLEVNGAYKVAKRIKARRGIVLEPTSREDGSIEIAIGCRGSYRYRVDVLGKSCHSGHPERGENAIYKSCSFIDEFRKVKPPRMMIKNIGEVPATASITQIEAKEGANVIPGKCSLTIDYRAIPGEEEGEIESRINHICRQALGKNFNMEKLSGIPGGVFEEEDFLEECKIAVRSVGCVPVVDFNMSRNDSAIFNKYAGAGCYVMGPGTRGQPHKINEYCNIKGLIKTTEAVIKVVEKYAVQ